MLLLLLVAGSASPAVAASSAAASSTAGSSDSSKSRELYCALCEAVVDEMEAAIGRVEQQHGHTVQTAWRIDEKRRIPYARTESVLLQLLEDDVPPLLRLYGVSNHSGRQRLLRRHDAAQLDTAPLLPDPTATDTDSSLPYSPSEFASSGGVTAALSALYERLLDSWLEDIVLAFHKRQHDDIKDALCVKTIRACRKGTTFEPFRRPSRQGQQRGGEAEQGHAVEEHIDHTDL